VERWREKILIIDDDMQICKVYKTFLERKGFHVCTAENGEAGIASFTQRAPDCALVDLRMPDMNGLSVIEKLHELSDECALIVLSGTGSTADVISATRAGAWDYIEKPPRSMSDFLWIIRRNLERLHLLRERKKAEAALVDSEKRFRLLADYTTDWEYWRLPDFSFAYVSPAVSTITGYGEKFFYEQKNFDIVIAHEEDRPKLEEHVLAVRDTPVPCEFRYRLVHRSGEIRWVQHCCQPMWSESGEYIGERASNRDITEKVLLEEKSRQNVEMFKQLSENIHEVYFLIDTQKQELIYLSPAFEKIAGVRQDQISLSLQDIVAAIVSEDRKRLHITPEWVNQDRQFDVELRFRRADNDIRWVRLRTFPIKNETGGICRVAGIAADITEKKNALAKERAQTEQLMQADKMASLGFLVSGVAHEINNPNNFIMLNQPLLKKVWHDALPILDKYNDLYGSFNLGGIPYSRMREKIPAMLSGIENGARRIQRIVDDLKNYVRKDTHAGYKKVDITAVVKNAIQLMKSTLKRKTRHFNTQFPPDPVYIKGNAQKLEQVIINLIQNSCEALPSTDKTITVTVSREHCACNIVVADDGVGISTSDLYHITDPFFTTKREHGGTGLGLAVSSNIVNKHGGTIQFKSRPGEGTVVTVSIPLDMSKPVSAVVEPQPLVTAM